MGCNTCSDTTEVSGCKSNGNCQTGGCNKMNVFDWLSNMEIATAEAFNVVEVRFKNGRKHFFKNHDNLSLTTGDAVVVDVPNGHHIGYVSLQGELVRLQMQKKKVKNDREIKKIYRIASQRDLEKLEEVKKRELPTLHRTRKIIQDFKLQMKLSDIEYQADNTKATFYYSASDRVDFRELIKVLGGEFHIRIEMKQISMRQEAGRLGGIGSCGRELCCSTWLSDFNSVSTSAARYQNLSLNPSKLSGQCGRLKCCLNYELDTYMDALKDIPKVKYPLQTEKGSATLQKTDIFKQMMWFSYPDENTWIPVGAARVKEIIQLNKDKVKPFTLLENEEEEINIDAILNSDLVRMDKKYTKKKPKNRNNRQKNRNRGPRGNSNNRPNNRNRKK